MSRLRLVVLGTVASNPYAGMAWMTMQITAGLRRLGHEAYYFETTSTWPYDPIRQTKTDDSAYAVAYLAKVAGRFGLDGRWAYRRSYSDREWLGMDRASAEALLRSADAVFNVAGATSLSFEKLDVGRLVYLGTDPVIHEVGYAAGTQRVVSLIDEHDDVVTYGENIGTSRSPIPPLPRLRAVTRQPVLIDEWACGPPSRETYTTVGNWKQGGLDLEFGGSTYLWSKHHEFLKFIDLPGRIPRRIELAMNLHNFISAASDEVVPALGLSSNDRDILEGHDWDLVESRTMTTDPWPYHDYICASRGEFTVARDLNVRLRSGWFSERSACYLAAGRPVITQDTGFGDRLPTGEGLFAFNTIDEAVAAFEAVEADYERHSRAARAIAEEHFRAETVLGKLLTDLGLT